MLSSGCLSVLPVSVYSRAMLLHEPAQHQPQLSPHQEQEQHADSQSKEQRSQQGIVEAKNAIFQIIDDLCRLLERDGSICVVDHQHIAIAFIIISSPIAGKENG